MQRSCSEELDASQTETRSRATTLVDLGFNLLRSAARVVRKPSFAMVALLLLSSLLLLLSVLARGTVLGSLLWNLDVRPAALTT